MKNLYFLLIVTFLLSTNISFSQKKKKEKKEEISTGKINMTFAKTKSAWQIGLFSGSSWLVGDVSANVFRGNNPPLPGFNFGFFVSKSWSYLVSTRLRYSASTMYTNDPVASTLTFNQFSATNRHNDNRFKDLSPGQIIFHNSRTQGHDINLDLVFTLGNLNWHKKRSPVVFRMFPTLGMYMYQAFYDQLDENGAPYDYSALENLNDLGSTSSASVIRKLAKFRDGKYETRAEEHTVYDENKILGYTPIFTYGVGAGLAIRLTNFLSLDIETRQLLTSNDLIDGMQWQEPGSNTGKYSRNKTLNTDSYNQTTIGFTFSIITKKVGESLCMQNPLWGTDAFANKTKQEANDKKIEEIDSENEALKEQISKLEKNIGNMDVLMKLMAAKAKSSKKEPNVNNTGSTTDAFVDNKIGGSASDAFNNNKKPTTNDLNNEQKRLEDEANKLSGGIIVNDNRKLLDKEKKKGVANDLLDDSYKLRNGERMYIADLKGDIKAAYYLVTGSFKIKSNAKKDQKVWTENGITTYLMTDFKSSLYRVVIDYSNDRNEVLDLLDDYQKKVLKTIWVIKAE